MRPSMVSARMAEPAYSITCPVPPAVPILPMIARMMSFAQHEFGSSPSTRITMVLGLFWTKHWVANTCSTSLVPMPKANAPKAPWVDVWESPQTMVMPGSVNPCSGPITCTIPWRTSFMPNRVIPKAPQFSSRVVICFALTASAIPNRRSVVGTLWSGTASVAAGLRTRRPANFSASNACGDVTSCTRCRSM